MSRAAHLRRVAKTPADRGEQEAPRGVRRGRVASSSGAAVRVGVDDLELAAVIPDHLAGWSPSVGDEVTVAIDDVGAVILAVVGGAARSVLRLADGATVEVDRDAVELRDADGNLLVHYRDGHAAVAAPSGDLVLQAPSGRVRIQAATDVTIEGARDVGVVAGRQVDVGLRGATGDHAPGLRVERARMQLSAPELRADAKTLRVHATTAQALARELLASAERVVTKANLVETVAERVSVQAKSVIESVSGLLETRAGRVRAVVAGAWSLRSQSSAMRSKDDTAIDGRRVLLG